MVDELSTPLDIAELLVPDGLISVKFEAHTYVPGVSQAPFNLLDHLRELTSYVRTSVGGLPHVGGCPALVYDGKAFE